MKNLVFKTKYLLLALLVTFSISCSPEDGDQGPQGPQGEQGVAGTNGQDGNANVQTITINTATLTGTSFSLVVNEITQDVLDNDAILTYLMRSSQYYSIPGISVSDLIEVELAPDDLDIYFYNRTDGAARSVPAGRYTLAKIVIIESTSTVSRASKTDKKQQVYNELHNAGVDINDYYAVCDYYGVAY